MFNQLPFFFREALISIRRNPIPSFAAIMATLVTVLVLGVFIPGVQLANGAADDVRKRVLVSVVLKSKAGTDDINRISAALKNKPHVKTVEFVSKEEAYKQKKKEMPEAYALLGKNPLPDLFRVTPDDAKNTLAVANGLQTTGASGKKVPFDNSIEQVLTSETQTKKVVGLTSALKWSLGTLAGLLILASVLLISNTIRLSLFSRRREIEVMKLVGATDSFIRWPFVIEGLILGTLGGVGAVALLALANVTILNELSDIATVISQPQMTKFGPLVLILLLASILVSAAGSALSLRRFLKV